MSKSLTQIFSLLAIALPLFSCQADGSHLDKAKTNIIGFEEKSGRLEPIRRRKVAESYAEFTQEQAYEGNTSLKFFFQIADGHGARAEFDASDLLRDLSINEPGGAIEFYALSGDAFTFRLQFKDENGKKAITKNLARLLTPGKWQRVLVPIASLSDRQLNLPLSVDRFVLQSHSNTLYLDRLRYVPEKEYEKLVPQKDKGQWTISHPEKKVLWFKLGEPLRIPLGFENATSSALNIHYAIAVEDFWGEPIYEVEDVVTVQPGANPSVQAIALDTSSLKYGGYFIKAVAKDDGGALLSEIDFTFGIIGDQNTSRGKEGDFLYGGGLAGKGFTKETLDPTHPTWYVANYFGLDRARLGVSFETIWLKQDLPWNWQQWDIYIENHRRIGVKPYIMVGFFPTHLSGSLFKPPQDLSPFYKYVEELVKRYGDDVDTYEIWNEADWGAWDGPMEKYIEMYLKCYEIIKKHDPDAKVMNSGWAFSDTRGSLGKIKQFLKAVPPEKLDIFAFHAHGSAPEMLWKMKQIRKLLKSTGHDPNMEIWDTESGRTGDDIFVAQQLVKKHIYLQITGGQHLQWFTLANSSREAKWLKHKKKWRTWRWGMFRSNYLEPRPQAIAYWALIRTLRGYKYRETLNLGNNLQAFIFENGDTEILVYWLEQIGKKKFEIRSQGRLNPKQIDIFANEQTATVKNNQILLEATPTPAYLKWKNIN